MNPELLLSRLSLHYHDGEPVPLVGSDVPGRAEDLRGDEIEATIAPTPWPVLIQSIMPGTAINR